MPGSEYDNLVQTESKDVTSGGTFTLSAVYAASACADGMYGVDFAAMTLADCELLFMKPVDQCEWILGSVCVLRVRLADICDGRPVH